MPRATSQRGRESRNPEAIAGSAALRRSAQQAEASLAEWIDGGVVVAVRWKFRRTESGDQQPFYPSGCIRLTFRERDGGYALALGDELPGLRPVFRTPLSRSHGSCSGHARPFVPKIIRIPRP